MWKFICIEFVVPSIVTVELNWPFLRQLWFQKQKRKRKEWCPLID